MAIFIMTTRLNTEAVRALKSLEQLERSVMERVQDACPAVSRRGSFATLGPYDYLDIFEAPDIEAAMQVAALIRTHGHARTEVWPATDWSRFKELMRALPA